MTEGPAAEPVGAAELRAMLQDGRELALLDMREEGAFFRGHLLLAVNLPLSRLELRLADLVPRKSTRIVLCDGGDGLAQRAAARMRRFGYVDLRVLAGGTPGWQAAGFELFSGMNVPSKAFGELVEHAFHTPSVSAEELKAMMDRGEPLVVLDSRPMDEFEVMNIPGGICCPGGELVWRAQDVVPSADATVVVNCAGRTRSIIGAQSLINAGIAKRVVALRNGTMGWHLAGLQLERGQRRAAPAVSPQGRERARAAAAAVAARFGVESVDRAMVETWRLDPDRTLYLLDVRSPEEYAAGHLAGSLSAPGGQLVQATDRWAGVLGARLVLVDDGGVRATMAAHWLKQMGWEVYVLAGGLPETGLETGDPAPAVLGLDESRPETVSAQRLHEMLDSGAATAVDLADSRSYRRGHIPGAIWAVRSRIGKALDAAEGDGALVLTSEDGVLARLAASELQALTARPVLVLEGGTAAWKAAGLPLAQGGERMADETDDVALKPYDRDRGVEDAMREYLSWEIDLVAQVARDGTARFRVTPG